MKLDWPHDRCVFCKEPFNDTEMGSRSDAHIVPESLGGRIKVDALCKTCNSGTGAGWEHELPLDPTLRAEIEKFAESIPLFREQLSERS
jgi:hypothetical protein